MCTFKLELFRQKHIYCILFFSLQIAWTLLCIHATAQSRILILSSLDCTIYISLYEYTPQSINTNHHSKQSHIKTQQHIDHKQHDPIYTRLTPFALLALGPLVVLVPLEDFPAVVGLLVGDAVTGALEMDAVTGALVGDAVTGFFVGDAVTGAFVGDDVGAVVGARLVYSDHL